MRAENDGTWMLEYILWIPDDNSTRSPGYVDDLTSLEDCREKKKTISINRKHGYCLLHASAHGPNGENLVI